MVQCGSLFYILWLSCVPRVCQKSSILTLSIVFLAIDQKTDVTLLISLLPLSRDSNINVFPYSPLSLDETDFPVLQNEMEINKFSEIRALLPHDHETNCKAAEMFHESELLVQQKEANKRKTRSLSKLKSQTEHVAPAAKKAVTLSTPSQALHSQLNPHHSPDGKQALELILLVKWHFLLNTLFNQNRRSC